jgi:hypothetical protein
MKHLIAGAVAAAALLGVAAQAAPVSGPVNPADTTASATVQNVHWRRHRYWRHRYWHRTHWRHRHWHRW